MRPEYNFFGGKWPDLLEVTLTKSGMSIVLKTAVDMIQVSVNMAGTGFDWPEVVNLFFARWSPSAPRKRRRKWLTSNLRI